MPRNIAHQAQRKLERTVRRLRAFCATEHTYTTAESLWAAVENNKSGAVFFFDLARLLRLNRKTRHSLLRLKSRPESRAAGPFKEEFFNLYKILRLRCTPQHQDEDALKFLPGLYEPSVLQRVAAHMSRPKATIKEIQDRTSAYQKEQ